MAKVTEVKVYESRLMIQSARISQRFIRRALNDAQQYAQAIAATGPYSRGRLAHSIYNTGPSTRGWTTTGSVGSRLPYAASVESGARIHDIFPRFGPHVYRFGKPGRPALKFYWNGKLVIANQVPMSRSTVGRSHPGQKGKNYLTRALFYIALRHNMTVIIYNV